MLRSYQAEHGPGFPWSVGKGRRGRGGAREAGGEPGLRSAPPLCRGGHEGGGTAAAGFVSGELRCRAWAGTRAGCPKGPGSHSLRSPHPAAPSSGPEASAQPRGHTLRPAPSPGLPDALAPLGTTPDPGCRERRAEAVARGQRAAPLTTAPLARPPSPTRQRSTYLTCTHVK